MRRLVIALATAVFAVLLAGAFVPASGTGVYLATVYDLSAPGYGGASHSVQAHTSEAALVASDEVSEGVQEGVSAAAGPLSILFPKSVAANSGGASLDKLAASGSELDPADAGAQLTRAGRAFAKASEVFGSTSGGPSAINSAGQSALNEILTNPGTVRGIMQGGNFAGGLKFVSPDGIGAVFGPDGTFQYFGRMAP